MRIASSVIPILRKLLRLCLRPPRVWLRKSFSIIANGTFVWKSSSFFDLPVYSSCQYSLIWTRKWISSGTTSISEEPVTSTYRPSLSCAFTTILQVNKTKANNTFFISSILIVQPLLQNANYHFTKLLKKTVKPILSQEINQAFSIHQNSIAILYLTLGRCFAGK